MKRMLFAAGAAIALLSAGVAEATITASGTIDTRAAGVRIAPEIYGQFSEELGHGIDGGIWV
ncbi:MAG TPA: alpha-N-arabinofuranosidase, partial [Sphingomicrobium sp.]|nr:alpha-N-arabinofuranosidase [Sphingomicrobium sp.]